MYKALLFDVDQTLLDFKKTEDVAFRRLMMEEGIPYSQELFDVYETINHKLWHQYELGEINRDVVLNTRFILFYQAINQDKDASKLEERYQFFLSEGAYILPKAFDLIKKLSQEYPLYIITNGVANTQYKRLKKTGLFPFFKDIFISEEIGFQKPACEFFKYVFERIPFLPSETVVIGDSLSSDIQGGINYGIDTIWYNPNQISGYLQPTYEIKDLEELYFILGEEKYE